jgi:hypothetical protein
VKNEYEGIPTVPSSADVLDAYVVPICLEKARMNGLPVCDWTISYSYISLPAVVYGLNYFSTPSDHFMVSDLAAAKKVIRHVTNFGKYPFCYQKIDEDATIMTCSSIFGKTINCCDEVSSLADRIYQLFRIPLVEIVLVRSAGQCSLSALAPVRYSQLSDKERELLQNILEMRENQ